MACLLLFFQSLADFTFTKQILIKGKSFFKNETLKITPSKNKETRGNNGRQGQKPLREVSGDINGKWLLIVFTVFILGEKYNPHW